MINPVDTPGNSAVAHVYLALNKVIFKSACAVRFTVSCSCGALREAEATRPAGILSLRPFAERGHGRTDCFQHRGNTSKR